jgi:hypothetical protein
VRRGICSEEGLVVEKRGQSGKVGVMRGGE